LTSHISTKIGEKRGSRMQILLKKYKWYGAVILVVVTFLLWYIILGETNQKLEVSFLDVGQGDAIFIEAPNGNQILIDGGPPNGKVLRELRHQMPFYDRFIDVVIATHPDQDHIGGLVDVLERYEIGLMVDSGLINTTDVYIQKEKIVASKKLKKINARRGVIFDIDEDIKLEILFPDRDVDGLESNTASIIARLVYKEHEFLFTGDSPKSIENYIVSFGDVESDVLKVGHHGSNTSTSPLFLAKVNPKYAVVSAGLNNRYGHPHKEVLKLLEDFKISVFETSKLGTVTFISNGRELVLK